MNIDKDWFYSLEGKKVLPREKGTVFITIEGADGAGKSTQIELLRKYFEGNSIPVLITKEPTMTTNAGKRIRRILFGEEEAINAENFQGLYTEDRKEHLESEIIPALKEDKIVLCDRYFFSTFAYAMLGMNDIESIVDLNKSFINPDLAITILAEPKICIDRLKGRGAELDFFEKIEKIEKIDKAYRRLVERFDNMVIVDGNASIEEVYEDVLGLVKGVIKKSGKYG